MRSIARFAVPAACFTILGSCAGSREFGNYDDGGSLPPAPVITAPPSATAGGAAVSDFPVKIGDPYDVAGTRYVPQDYGSYDEVGYASWYGEELAGNATANGEMFNPMGVSAAHKTLPLPSYVEVTALDTGKTILVRVNDRGPFANDRLIDLSRGAAEQLGIVGQGPTGVRVRKVTPNEQEKAVLRSGGPVTERIETPDSLLTILRKKLAEMPRPAAAAPIRTVSGATRTTPPPAPAESGRQQGRFIVEDGTGRRIPVQPPQESTGDNYVGSIPGSYVVQVAAFGSKSRADAMAKKIGAKVMPDAARNIWRVRYGPYASEQAAEDGLRQARSRGYGEARIMRAD